MRDFDENVASSLEGKGKKLEKRGLKTELDWKSSRIHLQTKKVHGTAGREESGVKDRLFLKDAYIVRRRILRKLRNRNNKEGEKECQLD